MLIKAADEFDIDLSESFLIGDNLSDIEAGRNAKLKTSFLIKREKGDLYFYRNANQNHKISLNQLIDIFLRFDFLYVQTCIFKVLVYLIGF